MTAGGLKLAAALVFIVALEAAIGLLIKYLIDDGLGTGVAWLAYAAFIFIFLCFVVGSTVWAAHAIRKWHGARPEA